MPICASCGEENSEEARFCFACGVRFGAARAARELRKTVTVLFSDVTGSTAIGELLDPEALRRLMLRWYQEMKTVCEGHGGRVRGLIGDAVMAAFGVPTVHEDDALRAVRAAAEMRQRLEALNDELDRDFGLRLRSRTGVNTGEVIVRDPDPSGALALGDAVNVAARLEQAAEPGEVLLGQATYALVEDAVRAEPVEPLSLKGKAERVSAFRLLEVLPHAEALIRHFEMPLVGRELELAQLRQSWQRAVRERRCHLVTVFGHAGIGKTRLSQELARSVQGEASVLTGRCLSYGKGITYWPIREIVAQAAGSRSLRTLLEDSPDAEVVAERIESAIGVDTGGAVKEEIFWALRKLVEAVGRERPVLLVFEDIHWAEPTLLDLIEYLADWVRDVPVLVVCLARPELLDERPTWGGGKLNASSVLLDPLSAEESSLLIAALPAAAPLAPEARARITTAAEGNPLFLEQMLAMLAQREDGFGEVAVPPAIQSLLTARLEQLPAEERRLLECASIEGEIFHVGGVVALSSPESREAVTSQLMSLVRRELIRAESATLPGDDAFRFRHALIRDAAYTGLPKEARSELHERHAAWLEEVLGDHASEADELLGYHLEQAQRCLSELGPLDDHGRALARRGGEVLADAGRRAGARGDHAAAANLLGRARALLPAEAARARDIDPLRARALIEGGELVTAEAELQRAVTQATAASDRRAAIRAEMELIALHDALHGAHSVTSADVSRAAVAAIPILEATGDVAGLARAWQLSGDVHWTACRWSERAVSLERALTYAQQSGDAHAAAIITRWLALGTVYDSTPVESGIARCTQLLEQAPGPYAEAAVKVALAALHAMATRFDKARALYAEARTLDAEIGSRFAGAAHCLHGATIALLAGDNATAERELRAAYEVLREMGEHGLLSTVAGQLGRVLYQLQRFADADEMTSFAQQITPADDIASITLWQATRAKLLARSGDHQQALRLAKAALALVATTDALNEHAQTHLDLAEVLRLDGRTHEAALAVERACDLYETKGNIAGATIARTLHAKLIAAER